MKKRILTALLCICLAIGLMPVAAFAAETTPWDGSVATAYADGLGTEDDPYQIATAAQLAYLSELCAEENAEAVTEKYWRLTADIDLNDIPWTPIGAISCYPTGTFDGDGHTISGFYLKKEGSFQNSFFGIFGVFEGQLKNLTVTGNMEFYNAQNGTTGWLNGSFIGGLCGLCAADVENCRSEVNITVEAALNATSVGGLIGDFQSGVLQNSMFTGTIRSTSQESHGEKLIGGVTGDIYLGTVNSCKNEGDIIAAFGHIGGIAGMCTTYGNSGKNVIANCVNTGTIELERTGQIGGIIGYASAVNYKGDPAETQVVNCLNLGNVRYTGTKESDLQYVQIGPVYGRAEWTASNSQAMVDVDNCYYVNDAAAGNATVTENEKVQKKTLDEIKTPEFRDLIANNDNYENSTAYWVQAKDGSIGLTFEVADYSKVEAALARVPADLTLYTDASAQAVDHAVKAVQYDLRKTQQATVDGYAAAIEAALAALEYKEADYTKVEEAIAKAKALDKEQYKDFSAVDAAMNAVIRGKKITEQTQVDEMAKNIEAAISLLEKKPEVKTNDGKNVPQTGDNGNVLPWLALLLVSGVGLVGNTVYTKKRKYSK